jgi:quinol monooxygenase YgiN
MRGGGGVGHAPDMPVAVRITPKQLSRDDYEKLIDELEATGAGEPDGRQFHAAYGDDEVHMFEVWESREHFEDHRDSLMAVLQGAGVDAGTVEIHELHASQAE